MDESDVWITEGDVVKAVQFLRDYSARHQDDPEYSGLIWSVCVAAVAAGNWMDLQDRCDAVIAKLGELGSAIEQQAFQLDTARSKLGVALAALEHMEPSARNLLAATAEHGAVHDLYWRHAIEQARSVVGALDAIRDGVDLQDGAVPSGCFCASLKGTPDGSKLKGL